MENPKLCILLASYNGEKYIKEQLDSIINQTYKNIEIILVNDGSKDNSRDICEEYEKNYENVSLINQENGGLSAARNTGLKYVKGEAVTFVDSDDWLELDAIEYYVDSMKKELLLRIENYHLKNFPNTINNLRESIVEKEIQLKEAMESFLAQKRNVFETKIDKISVLNPINTLKRGYTVSQVKNKRIDVLDDIEINDEMITILKDGKVISVVKEKIYEKNIN